MILGPTVLGAVLAGGQSRRFGRDKALAEIDGETMMAHVLARITPQVNAVVICGRQWPGMIGLTDVPTSGLGPLGGLAAALLYAEANGYETVLSAGCDLPNIPPDLLERLKPAPAVVSGQPLLGLWPASLARTLRDYLATADDRSMRGWLRFSAAREIELDALIANINTAAELDAFLNSTAPKG